MHQLPNEILDYITLFLNHYENLILSSCIKNNHLFNIDRKKIIKKISIIKLYPYVSLSSYYIINNPLIYSYDDFIEFKNDLSELSIVDKRDCIFSCMYYFIKRIMTDYNQNVYVPLQLYPSHNPKFFYVDKFAISYKKLNSNSDISRIKYNVKISSVYNVSLHTYQYREIRKSLTLKAIVG